MENLIELKKVTSLDAEFLTKLLNNKTILKILNEKRSKLKDWQTAIDNWSKDNDEENYIIYCDNIPVGWIGINSLLSEDKKPYIKMFALLPEYRFHGIGQYVINFIKDELKNRGYLSLKLVTDKENKHAIHCYEKCGFAVTETFTKKMLNGKTVQRYKMICVLKEIK